MLCLQYNVSVGNSQTRAGQVYRAQIFRTVMLMSLNFDLNAFEEPVKHLKQPIVVTEYLSIYTHTHTAKGPLMVALWRTTEKDSERLAGCD